MPSDPLVQDDVPLPVLEEVAKRPEEAAKLMLLANSKTPEPVLKKLVEGCPRSIVRAAKLHVNWSEPIEGNLHEIAQEEMRTVVEGPYFDHDALKRVAEIGAIPEWLVYKLLGKPKCLPILEEAARSPLTRMNILEKIAVHGNYQLRSAVATNPLTTADILEELAESADSYVLQQVLRHPNTPTYLLESWMQQDVPTLCYAIACNPHAPTKMVADWIRRLDWQSATQFAKISDSPASFLEQLANHPHPAVLPAVAAHPHTPSHLLEQWAKIPDDSLQLVLLKNPATPAQTLFSLLAENPKRCIAIAKRLGEGKFGSRDLATQICEHLTNGVPDFESLFTFLIQHNNYYARAFAASLSGIPIDLLESLINDSSPNVLLQLAKNPQTSEKTLNILLEQVLDTEQFAPVVSAICQHPNSCLNTIVEKLNQADLFLIRTVFSKLAERCAIEAPQLLTDLLHITLKINYGAIGNLMFLCLLHPLIKPEILSSMAQMRAWLNRYAIAQHPNTPTSGLERLTRDANRVVCAAAQESLRQRAINVD